MARKEGLRRLEGPIAVAQQQGDRAAGVSIPVGDRQILHAIAIEVGHRRGYGTKAHTEDQWRPEGSIAVAQQHRDGVARSVAVESHCQILPSIAIEVAHSHGCRTAAPRREVPCRLEGPIAVAEQHRDGGVTEVGYR